MSSPLDSIFAGVAATPSPYSVPPLGRGFPLPNTSAAALDQLKAPQCSDWPIRVRSLAATTTASQQQQQQQFAQHPLSRGEAIQFHTGERGIYLGRPAFGSAVGSSNYSGGGGAPIGHSSPAAGATMVCCVMRDATGYPPFPRILNLDSNAATNQLMFVPVVACPKCGGKVPVDEIAQHEQVAHSSAAGSVRQAQQPQQPAPPYQQQQPQQQQLMMGMTMTLTNGNGGGAASAAASMTATRTQTPVASPMTPTAGSTARQTPNGVFIAGDAELMRHLKKGKKLGEGAQGTVWQCAVQAPYKAPQLDPRQHPVSPVFDPGAGTVVLKSIKCADAQIALNRFHLSEQLMRIKSTHLVPYFAVIYDPRERDTSADNNNRDTTHIVHVIMPFYSCGTLSEKIQKQRGKFSEQWLLSTMLQLSNALQVLHTHRPAIAHGDVKPDNIMLFGTNSEQVLLMDLEASSIIPPGQKMVKADNDGTFEWRAPESAERDVGTWSDMWSLGVVAMVLALLPDFPALKNPETGQEELLNMKCWNDSRLYWSVKDAVVAKGYGERTAEIICSLLRLEPANRPTTQVCSEVITDYMEKLIFAGKF